MLYVTMNKYDYNSGFVEIIRFAKNIEIIYKI